MPYELHHEEWALERTVRLFGIKKGGHGYGSGNDKVTRVENYTACFPTTMDGQIYAKQLTKCRGMFPRLFVLNGLAGEGIARGPGAGLYMAQLVGKALNKTDGPEDLPQRGLVWVLEDLGSEFAYGTVIFLCGLTLLSGFLFCIHWQGPRQGRFRMTHRREAGEKFFFFLFFGTCVVPLIAMSAIAVEALALLGGYFVFCFAIVGCVLLWKRHLWQRAYDCCSRRKKTGAYL